MTGLHLMKADRTRLIVKKVMVLGVLLRRYDARLATARS